MKQVDQLYPNKAEVLGYYTNGTFNGKALLVDKNKNYFDDGRPTGFITLRSLHLASVPRVSISHDDYKRSGLASVQEYVEFKLSK